MSGRAGRADARAVAEQRMQDAWDHLRAGVADLYSSGRYGSWLASMMRFRQYSVRNTALILSQCPQATYVASYSSWKRDFNRQVRRGEHGLLIMIPCCGRAKEPDAGGGQEEPGAGGGQEEQAVRPYFIARPAVFDVSQTDGDPLPELARPLSGDVAGWDRTLAALMEASPVPVTFGQTPSPDVRGLFSPEAGVIVVRPDMSELQTCKTVAHEVAHAVMHARGSDGAELPREVKEIQAESVAYVVCDALGLDTSDYSFGYVAGWAQGRDPGELLSMAGAVKAAAATIEGGMARAMGVEIGELAAERERSEER